MISATIKHMKSYYGWQARCICCGIKRKYRKEAHKRLRPLLKAMLRKEASHATND